MIAYAADPSWSASNTGSKLLWNGGTIVSWHGVTFQEAGIVINTIERTADLPKAQ